MSKMGNDTETKHNGGVLGKKEYPIGSTGTKNSNPGNKYGKLVICVAVMLACFPSYTQAVMINDTLKIAWMAPYPQYFISASSSIGALSYAVDVIDNDPSLLPNINSYHVNYRDSGCNPKNSIGAIFSILEDNYDMDVVVGPGCSAALQPVAAIASHLNVPALGWIANYPVVADKSIFTTLVRFLWPTDDIGQGLEIVLDRIGWRRVFIVSSEGTNYGVVGNAVRNKIHSMKDDGYVIARWWQDVPIGASNDTIQEIYSSVKEEARIVLMCTPLNELRTWMLNVYDADMWHGEYVFLYINQDSQYESAVNQFYSTDFWEGSDGRGDEARLGYENCFMMFPKPTSDAKNSGSNSSSRVADKMALGVKPEKSTAASEVFEATNEFLANFTASATASGGLPFNYTGPPITVTSPDFFSLCLYDAMILYARAATEVYEEQGNDREGFRDGLTIFNKLKNTFSPNGASGNVILDENADREGDYWIFDLDADGHFIIGAETSRVEQKGVLKRTLIELQPLRWGDGTKGISNAPTDTPECGFDGELCKSNTLYIAVGATLGALVLIAIVIILVCRKLRYERMLNNQVWRVNQDDLHKYTGAAAESQFNLRSSKASVGAASMAAGGQLFIQVANYRDRTVAIIEILKDKVKIDRALLQEMSMMISMKHPNLNVFVGANVDGPDVSCVWEYCPKGSLQDVIANDNLQLDDMFKFSIIMDILKGLRYLINTELKVHGRLKTSNILIDGRWAAKLTDYGCIIMRTGQQADEEESDHAKFSKLFSTAPEVLRAHYQEFLSDAELMRGSTHTADIFSMGVVLKEVFCRNDAYAECDDLDPKQIVEKVKQGGGGFRPSLTHLSNALNEESVCAPLTAIINSCWQEDPKDRPTLDQLTKQMSKANPFKTANVMDNMVAMMEKYSLQLEGMVAEREQHLEEEKKKTENLLYKMLPRSVADDLKMGKAVKPESFDKVTIYFADIVGFGVVAARSTPFQIVDMLNAIYSLIDAIIPRHDVYKVETVGDVYLLASGLPNRNGDRHIVEVVNCALDIISETDNFVVPHEPDAKINVRVGVHTGPVVTGVIGLTNPRYCLFGDTVNTSSRMESNGFARRIHLSSFAYEALCKYSGFLVASRGVINVKGKGTMNTYWLGGREDYDKPLPDYQTMLAQDSPAPTFLPPTTGKSIKSAPSTDSTNSGSAL